MGGLDPAGTLLPEEEHAIPSVCLRLKVWFITSKQNHHDDHFFLPPCTRPPSSLAAEATSLPERLSRRHRGGT